MAALAHRIKDLGGTDGIIISPRSLQLGAKPIAEHEHIAELRLAADSTTENYIAQFLAQTFHHATVKSGFAIRDICSATVVKAGDG